MADDKKAATLPEHSVELVTWHGNFTPDNFKQIEAAAARGYYPSVHWTEQKGNALQSFILLVNRD